MINNSEALSQRVAKRIEEIKRLYLQDDKPWIIGYSGGKDSSATLQLTWHALSQLPIKDRQKKEIHIISNDTLVENPFISKYIRATFDKIAKAAEEQKISIVTHILYPKIEDSFWVNLLGRGYPAPQQNFRWCTDRLKIRPTTRFIREHVSKYGEIILVLGIRKDESMTRAQVMSLHAIKGNNSNNKNNNNNSNNNDLGIYRHTSLQGTYIYAPIRDWSLDDVWSFLLQHEYSLKEPWASINSELALIYKKATNPLAMECPLQIDNTTPSCGGSRFGCWTCTVVKQDKSTEALIEHGEEWMLPLLELRNLLYSTHDPKIKPEIREYKRRAGYVSFKNDGSNKIVYGPYKLEFCKEVLRRLLTIQKELKKQHSNIILIREEELHMIRKIWLTERGDWEDSLPRIYKEVYDKEWEGADNIGIGILSKREASLLKEIADKNGLPFELVSKIIIIELQMQGISRRALVYGKLEKVLTEEWRDLEEIKKLYKEGIVRSDQIV